MRRLIKYSLAFALVALAAGGWWGYEYFPYGYWSGGFDLAVHVSGDAPIRAVRCRALGHSEGADRAEEWEFRPWSAVAEPFLGAPLTVRVNLGGSDSRSGREISRRQEQALVVIAEFSDGRTLRKVVDIPDGRAKSEVRVSFP